MRFIGHMTQVVNAFKVVHSQKLSFRQKQIILLQRIAILLLKGLFEKLFSKKKI